MPTSHKHSFLCGCDTTQHVAHTEPARPARRRFVGLSLAVSAAGGLGLGAMHAQVHANAMPAPLPAGTPDEALAKLMAGNARYLKLELTSFQQDYEVLRTHTSESQSPFAAILACSDSRVPVELIFDQSIGRIFTVRVAGNVAASPVIASLEYAVEALKVRALMVLGHSQCGAVKAAIANKDVPGQVTALYPYMRPALVNSPTPEYRAVVMQNAIEQAKVLSASSPVISHRIRTGELKVRAAIYDVETGKVELL
ncbi:carbonic anhydrase [Achromobacter aloeverae]